jgi:AbiTii-like protein
LTRQSEALKLADELLADIELSRLSAEKCILKGTRLARLVSDDDAIEWLRCELHGYDTSSQRWAELMTVTSRWVDDEKKKGYTSSLAALQGMLEAQQGRINALKSTSLSGDGIVIAQNNRFAQLNNASESIATISAIVAGVMAALHEVATRTYYELLFSEIQADLFTSMQAEIDGRVSPMMGGALSKIDVINERLRTGDTEAISHAMTTCRRLIDATADVLFPACQESAEIDGQEVTLDRSKVLNRLNLFAYNAGASKGRRDRLRRSLSDVYGRASKGVHDEVTPMEARFLFLQTYLTLGEFVTL